MSGETIHTDAAIIGSGFGGSLTAMVLARHGIRPLLVERGRHPRFAIGESSTPLADLLLRELADRCDLPAIRALTTYGAWNRACPHLACGLKRGFCYFAHPLDGAFVPRGDHANELFVAANPDAERGDTHWFRADVDAYFVEEARRLGARYVDETQVLDIEPGPTWRVIVQRGRQTATIQAGVLIDGSGESSVLPRALGLRDLSTAMHTHSRAVFSHFTGVRPWRSVHREAGGDDSDYPFSCDHAALHHVFDGGWMWVLRFDNGVTSAGFSLDPRRHPQDESLTAEQEWSRWLERLPSVHTQFRDARPVQPFRRTSRLQRRWDRAAGPNWLLLPHTAGFVDPFFSSGIAHTLAGIAQLAESLKARGPDWPGEALMNEYSANVLDAVDLVDRLVDGCFAGFSRFPLMVAYSMLYFIAATQCEQRRRRGTPRGGFLLSGEAGFREVVHQAHERVLRLSRGAADSQVQALSDELARRTRDLNVAGLFDPTRRNLYPFIESKGPVSRRLDD